MTGTLVNFVGVIIGSLIGLLFKKGIPEHINEAITRIMGLAIAIIGLQSLFSSMSGIDGKVAGLLLLISLVAGCLCGELIRIDDRLNNFGMWIENRIGAAGFSRGLITASLIFCIGAMSVIGPINDGLTGDASILYIKTILDGTTAIFLASTLGAGVLFSCVPLLVIQSIPALLARQLSPYISDLLLNMFCMVGYAIVICIGINFLANTKIKVANLLPSLVFPIVYYFITAF